MTEHVFAAKVGDVVGRWCNWTKTGFVADSNLRVKRILPSGRLVLEYIEPVENSKTPVLYPDGFEDGRARWKMAGRANMYPEHYFVRTSDDKRKQRDYQRRMDAHDAKYEAECEARRKRNHPLLKELKNFAASQGLCVYGSGRHLTISTEGQSLYGHQTNEIKDYEWEDVSISIPADLMSTFIGKIKPWR